MRAEADAAVKALGWARPYHVDADHIGLSTVDRFLDCSDFFTMDVAQLGKGAGPYADDEPWIVIEFGDGQVAGLPEHVDAEAFYTRLGQAFD